MLRAAALALLTALPAGAQTVLPVDPAKAAFVRANLVATFYHEVGHALIDTVDLTALQEEDTADVLSVLLIDRLWQDQPAGDLIRQVAEAYILFDARSGTEGDGLPYRDTHSLDLQRYYNFVCLFYGADPEAREGVADELDLPAERRESCPEEYEQAANGWGAVLDGVPPQDSWPAFRLVVPADRDAFTALVAAEVHKLNGEYGLSQSVDVTVEPCGEPNAFYDPRARRIVMCTEYADDLGQLYEKAAQ